MVGTYRTIFVFRSVKMAPTFASAPLANVSKESVNPERSTECLAPG